jgi:hypothetical protein
MTANPRSLDVELLLLQENRVVHVEPLAGRALFVGRNPDNDLVLTEATVSGRHALFFLDAAARTLRVRDLGSTNGTFLNDQRLTTPTVVNDGDKVRLGSSITIQLRVREGRGSALPAAPPSLLVDLHTGVAHPIHSDRIFVGGEPHCQIKVEGAPTACITLHDNGEIWLSSQDEEAPIEPGTPFAVADHELVFRSPSTAISATVRETVERVRYGYELKVALMAETGPEATIRDPAKGALHRVTAENRVSLLWVLSKKLQDDLAEGCSAESSGWCEDEEVMRGIWGRGWDQMGSNNYQVLLSRTRREFAKAGFDGWFIEKRRGHTRLRLQRVELMD